MNPTTLSDQLLYAEGLMVQGQPEQALELLSRLAEDAEEYVDRNCPTTDELQWFSFPTIFERLAYRRVENDPRELRDVGEPLDRLYADLALANVQCGDYDQAAVALRQAVRWNPMGCEHRLNLADLCRIAGDLREHLALSYSVFERASEGVHLVRAYVNFASYFLAAENPRAAAACLRVARGVDASDQALAAQLAVRERARAALAELHVAVRVERPAAPKERDVPGALVDGPPALDHHGVQAELGQRDVATNLTIRARDLVGEQAAMALLALIHDEDDAEEAADAS